MIIVDDSNFDIEVIQSKLPVLVDFSAVWCGPCHKQHEILKKISATYKDKVKVVEIDVDGAPIVTSKLHIRSVPTLILFKNGQQIIYQSGLSAFDTIVKLIQQYII